MNSHCDEVPTFFVHFHLYIYGGGGEREEDSTLLWGYNSLYLWRREGGGCQSEKTALSFGVIVVA